MTTKVEHNGAPKLTVAQQQAVMRNLNQQSTAWLIGKPADWLRNNAHQFDRTSDGKYDAREAVQTITRLAAGQYTPAEISDEHFGPLETFMYGAADCTNQLPGLLRIINEVEAAHGTALGLAAVGAMLKQGIEKFLENNPITPQNEAKIRAESEQRLSDSLCSLEYHEAERNCRVVPICREHGRYEWGRKWKPLPVPQGYIGRYENFSCDLCLK